MESNNQNIPGVVEWIGIREKSGSIKSVQHVLAIEDLGLKGDKITLKGSKKRQVTLMQKEHISVILSLAGEKDQLKIDGIQYYFKRNLLVSKCNIQNLKGRFFSIGGAKFYGTGDCKPCKKIENLLGKKMLDAMQGMGGITASVIQSGEIKINDNLNMEINK